MHIFDGENGKVAIVNKMIPRRERYNLQGQYESIHLFTRYYAVLETLLEFVKVACPIESEFYIKILRSIMTDHERVLLFYHVSSRYSSENLSKLVGKYNFFDELNEDDLFDHEHKDYLSSYIELVQNVKLERTLRDQRGHSLPSQQEESLEKYQEEFFFTQTPYRNVGRVSEA